MKKKIEAETEYLDFDREWYVREIQREVIGKCIRRKYHQSYIAHLIMELEDLVPYSIPARDIYEEVV